VHRTIEPCRLAVEKYAASMKDVGEVILVGRAGPHADVCRGGQGSVPCRSPRKKCESGRAVAGRACDQRRVLSVDVKDFCWLDVTPLSLGIETLGGIIDQCDREKHDHPDQGWRRRARPPRRQ